MPVLAAMTLSESPWALTRLREGGADVAQIQAILGHGSLDTSQRYFRAGATEIADLVDRVLGGTQ